eukprot:c5499_g1_i1.p1 GENE.c5499_g1_i1~~c5499_g1_i1.p1  ORF type:complete len:340 (-),score=63.42 c5499_g1_i1:57-1076(-)
MGKACSFGSGDPVFVTWPQDSCPPNALCVPTNNGTIGICSCEFGTEMLVETSRNTCTQSKSSLAIAAFYLILTLVGLFFFLVQLRVISRAERTKLKSDLVTISARLCVMTVFSLVLHHISRVFLIFSVTDTNFTPSYFSMAFTQVLVAFFVALTNMFFGLSMLIVVLQSSKLERQNTDSIKRVSFVIALLNGIGIGAIFVVFMLLRQYAVLNVVTALWLLMTWAIFRKVSLGLKEFKDMKETSPAMRLLDSASRSLMKVNFLILFCASVYVVVWYVGKKNRDSNLLAKACAGSMFVEQASLLLLAITIGRYVAIMFRRRDSRTRGAAAPTVLMLGSESQ